MIEGCKHGPKDLIPQPCAECEKDARREEERLAPLKAKMRDLFVKREYETRHEKPALTSDELEEIQLDAYGRPGSCRAHAKRLLAEVDRLRAELVALKAEHMTPHIIDGYDVTFWHSSYGLLSEAVMSHLDQFVEDDDVAEEAIFVAAIEKAGAELVALKAERAKR